MNLKSLNDKNSSFLIKTHFFYQMNLELFFVGITHYWLLSCYLLKLSVSIYYKSHSFCQVKYLFFSLEN